MNSSKAERRKLFDSFASKKLGDDMDAKSCRIFEQEVDDNRSTYAPMFLRIAMRAG
jgi:hypothetical protein